MKWNEAKLGLLAASLLFSTAALAEQGCPEGMFPGGTQPGRPICIPIPGARGGSVEQPKSQPPRWKARWGAIATDSTNGASGYASNQPSKHAAESIALSDCRRGANSACRVVIAYENQCVALVGTSDAHLVEAGVSPQDATDKALEQCRSAGVRCTVHYTGCSFAQRIY